MYHAAPCDRRSLRPVTSLWAAIDASSPGRRGSGGTLVNGYDTVDPSSPENTLLPVSTTTTTTAASVLSSFRVRHLLPGTPVLALWAASSTQSLLRVSNRVRHSLG